jgi:hypothetical protein
VNHGTQREDFGARAKEGGGQGSWTESSLLLFAIVLVGIEDDAPDPADDTKMSVDRGMLVDRMGIAAEVGGVADEAEDRSGKRVVHLRV